MFPQPQHYDKQLYSLADYERVANGRFFRHAHDYFNSGANDETTLKEQPYAFDKYYLKQAPFADPTQWKHMKTSLMGKEIESPLCVTSAAFQKMASPAGEMDTARACNQTKTPMVLSSWATTSNEEIGTVTSKISKIYQIYLSNFEETNLDIFKRIKASGFSALALTCDTQLLGKRLNDTRTKFSLPQHLKMGNFVKYQGEESNVKSMKGSGLSEFVKKHKNNHIGWDIIPHMKKASGLPVFAKGIMCKEDARLALSNGIDGIYVSNHGARQLDTTPSTIEILKEVADEVALYAKETGTKKVPVLFDGGVRKGSDILKALALGADTVWIGRPVLWALACEGQTGVENILRILNQELQEAMVSCGCYTLEDVRSKSILFSDQELLIAKM